MKTMKKIDITDVERKSIVVSADVRQRPHAQNCCRIQCVRGLTRGSHEAERKPARYESGREAEWRQISSFLDHLRNNRANPRVRVEAFCVFHDMHEIISRERRILIQCQKPLIIICLSKLERVIVGIRQTGIFWSGLVSDGAGDSSSVLASRCVIPN